MRIVLEPAGVTFIDDVGEEIFYALSPRQYDLAFVVINDRPCFALGEWKPYENATSYFYHYLKDAYLISDRRKRKHAQQKNQAAHSS